MTREQIEQEFDNIFNTNTITREYVIAFTQMCARRSTKEETVEQVIPITIPSLDELNLPKRRDDAGYSIKEAAEAMGWEVQWLTCIEDLDNPNYTAVKKLVDFYNNNWKH